jgi:hypothetical protein
MTRDEVAALLARAGGVEHVEINGLKIDVVELSFAARQQLGKIEGGDELMRVAIRAACYYPGTAQLMMDDEMISLMPMSVLTKLFEAIKRTSGIGTQEPLEPDPAIEVGIHEPSEAEKNA